MKKIFLNYLLNKINYILDHTIDLKESVNGMIQVIYTFC